VSTEEVPIDSEVMDTIERLVLGYQGFHIKVERDV